MDSKSTILVTKAHIKPASNSQFIEWQTKMNELIAGIKGFTSLEIQSSQDAGRSEWMIIQRFETHEKMIDWRESDLRKSLIVQLKALSTDGSIQENELGSFDLANGGVTEVFINQVHPDKDDAFREWVAKIHAIEATFPGFKGVYVQSPGQGRGKNWMTFLQFDTPENLDHWLNSPERAQILKESDGVIEAFENHRVISPYSGWFASVSQSGRRTAVWQQSMLVLLVLYPLVMLELKYLSPITSSLDLSIATFIGNMISVTLITWPMLPLAIWGMGWWLAPDRPDNRKLALGVVILLTFYVLEIILMWKLIKI